MNCNDKIVMLSLKGEVEGHPRNVYCFVWLLAV